MYLSAEAILIASRAHGETASIGRFLTKDHGLLAGYVSGGRGRSLRPLLIPGNILAIELTSKSHDHLPFAKVELVLSRGPWLSEPLPAAAISWASVLTATALPERNPYPLIFDALDSLLLAVCNAPAARGWLPAMISYETLLLRELGYGGDRPELSEDLTALIALFDRLELLLDRYLLADRRSNVMETRKLLRERITRMLS